jgi:hypothetical protein
MLTLYFIMVYRLIMFKLKYRDYYISWQILSFYGYQLCSTSRPEHLGSPPVYSGVRATRSLVLCVCLVDRCLSFCPFSFGHCVVCSSIYKFWLPLWYLQTLLTTQDIMSFLNNVLAFDLWPWKSIGFQILLRTKYVRSLVKIHWRMLILECSQGCYGRTDITSLWTL